MKNIYLKEKNCNCIFVDERCISYIQCDICCVLNESNLAVDGQLTEGMSECMSNCGILKVTTCLPA